MCIVKALEWNKHFICLLRRWRGCFPRSLSQVEVREHYSHHWSFKIEASNLVVMVGFALKVCMVTNKPSASGVIMIVVLH